MKNKNEDKDKLIIEHILSYICFEQENEYAAMIERDTDGKITKEDFHNWIMRFDVKKLYK